ncbi:transposase [Pseudomonas berkeleyensis]|uniref:Transposase n=1 Tax=Pseudomonas berkeleyensis TaxID=2726956 RepID=A0A7G5DUV5_9PSED|nr:transposase [Pseudomonas berkeleyensis]
MTQTSRCFPESFKREAVDQMLAGTPLRHVAKTLGIAESLLGKWKRQFEQQGDDAFLGNSKQRGESAELRRLRRQLAQIADYLARTEPHSPVPYVIRRAVEWGNQPLGELLDELISADAESRRLWKLLGVLK